MSYSHLSCCGVPFKLAVLLLFACKLYAAFLYVLRLQLIRSGSGQLKSIIVSRQENVMAHSQFLWT